jgi:hypothetical protein
MKVLLRNRTTGLYLCEPEGWSWHPALAREFRDSCEAFLCVLENHWSDMEAVLTFTDPKYDVPLFVVLPQRLHLPP